MKFTRIALGLAIAGLSLGAHATNGYFGHGYGMKAKGMAGAATTNTEDAFFGANNPAAAAFAGNRIDLGVDLFSPIREASRSGGGGWDGTVESDSNYFLIPEFGYNKMINPNLALGVTVYGNGGMNTDYRPMPAGFSPVCSGFFGNPNPPYNILCGTGSLGVDLMQLIVAPTAAYKIAPNHSLGISPLIGYQRFRAEGTQAFQGFSQNPSSLNNPGYDDSFGYGVRVGYLGKITPTVTIGAAYASRMKFDEFDKYSGLFANQGEFDIPENYNVGVSWQATPALKVALDYQRINYSDVDSVGNPVGNLAACMGGDLNSCMGGDTGPGFGWDDMNVWKLGVEYKYSKQWTFRAGYSHTDSPIKGTFGSDENFGEVTFNMLAPAVVEDHVTLGFTYTLASGNELTVAYMHAFKNDVSGAAFTSAFGDPSTEKIEMYQNSLGIQYSWKM